MFCSQCGKKLKDNMLFCPNCGVAIEFFDEDDEVSAVEKSAEVENRPAESMEQSVQREEIVPDEQEELVLFEEESVQPQETETVMLREEAVPVPEMPPIKRDRKDENETVVSVFDEPEKTETFDEEISFDEDEVEFVPLQLDESDDTDEMTWEKFEPKVERRPPIIDNLDEDALILNGRAPQLRGREEQAAARGEAQVRRRTEKPVRTFVPAKAMDPDDMFMDAEDPYDEFEDMEYADIPEGDFEFEDDVESNFVLRHIRGIMGFSLLVLLALVCMIYVFSETGQVALAKMNLAWNPEVYSKVAYDYYGSGLYEMSGSFYEKALARDEDNYNYALSAASAYIYAENTDKASGMLKKCISLDPTRPEPYIYLLNIYPDTANRPWDVSQLLQKAYANTGDDRLKSFAQ